MEDELLRLMANPINLRKIKKKPIDYLYIELQKNYPNYDWNEKMYKNIQEKIENDLIVINLKDTASPVLIKDMSDTNSFHVVMPMKI